MVQDAFNDPNAFNHYFEQPMQYNTTHIVPPPASPPHSIHRPSISHALPYESSNSLPNDVVIDPEYDQAQGRGSSDDDKDNLTPAQSRRKAQNRAAYDFLILSSSAVLREVQATSISREKRKTCQRPRAQAQVHGIPLHRPDVGQREA